MPEHEESHDLLQRLVQLGEQLVAQARQMDGARRVTATGLADLQATIAQLTDSANELEQYVETPRA